MDFRTRFYESLRDQKAPGRKSTKTFTWKQVMELFDEVWTSQVFAPGQCSVHGGCRECEVEQLRETILEVSRNHGENFVTLYDRLNELEKAIDQTGAARRDTGRGDEGVDSETGP